jgi:hypothetical protein
MTDEKLKTTNSKIKLSSVHNIRTIKGAINSD